MAHGSPTSDIRHVGDLGNIISLSSDRNTSISLTDSVIGIQNGNISNIMNRAIVMHRNSDNFMGASGNAGERIACGNIEPG